MTFINVDPATYYEAAKIINRAATAFFTTYSNNLKALEPTTAMAGSAGPGKEWAISYDQQVRETNNLVTALTMLLDRYNRALNLIGHTYALSDHNPASGTPPPTKPADPPLAFASCPIPPPSAGGPGSGLFDDGLELAKKIGVDLPVPDGDKDKLHTAATVWNTLAHAPEITNLPAELGRAADLFQTVTTPEVATIDDDLRTTKTAAEDLIAAFTDLANECAHQKTAHETMQGKLSSALDTFAKELGKEILVTAAITVAASAITFGIGALAVNAVRAGKFVKLVDDTIELLRDIVRAAGLRKIVTLTRNTTDTRTKLERLHDAIETAEDTVEASEKKKPLEWAELFKDGRVPKASELEQYAQEQGWTRSKTETGPIKYTDENGIIRLTIKRGTPRTPGSENPHVEIRNSDGQRVDPDGNHVSKSDPGNHTPIEMDLP
ncbi:hypothetical protein [Nocardia sp. NPDC051750]|uniref:hypothetical protein n=1 Tax=Nocardia sp. NPDC051750 TaxID=3364325 RepID=UPI0037A7ACA3